MRNRPASVRLHVPNRLLQGAPTPIDASQSHYLRTVMRLRAGDAIFVFNAQDGEWRARLATPQRSRDQVVIEEALRPAAVEPGPALLLASIRRERLEWATEKACELGVAEIRAVITQNAHYRNPSVERMRAIATEAAEQCGRLTVPNIRPPGTLADILEEWPAERRLVMLTLDPKERSFADVAPLLAADKSPAGLIVGPEGGFDRSELDALTEAPFVVAVRLGALTLRAETAAIAALACYQALAGPWRSDQPE